MEKFLVMAGKIAFAVAVVHLTVISITLYLHRGQTHRSLRFTPFIAGFFKFWLWLACGMDGEAQRGWIGVHRKHHDKTDTVDDPHNPKDKGSWKLFLGAFFYYRASVQELFAKKVGNVTEYAHYTKGIEEDNVDLLLNQFPPGTGLVVGLVLYTSLFGWYGFAVWVAQTLWMPFVAGGVINVLGHTVGRHIYDSGDSSRSLAPQSSGFLGWRWLQVVLLNWATGGEHLHNPHHFQAGSARFGKGIGLDFDIGYWWLRLFSRLGFVQESHVSTL